MVNWARLRRHHLGHDALDDHGAGDDVVDEPAGLAALHRPRLHVALHGSPTQAASAKADDLLLGAATALEFGELVGHLVADGTDGVAQGVASGDGGAVTGAHDPHLVVLVSDALGGADEASAQLDALGAEGQRRHQPAPVCHPAGCDHGHVHGIYHLGHERHGSHIAHVTAGLVTLRYQGVHPGAGQALSQGDGGHDRDDDNAGLLEPGDVRARVAGTGHDHLYPFLDAHADHVGHVGREEGDVDPEGPAGEALCEANLAADVIGRAVAAADHTQATSFGDGGGQLGGGDPGHAALQDGVLDVEQVT